MKKVLLLALASGLINGFAFGQSPDRKLGLEINTGFSDYYGEWNQQWFNFDGNRAQIGLTGTYYLNSWLNAGLNLSAGDIGHRIDATQGFRGDLFQGHAQLRLKFNNGKWLKEESMFRPYVYLGGGASHFRADQTPSLIVEGTDWTANGGLGFDVMLIDWFGLNYNLNYAYTGNDHRDGVSSNGNDQYMLHTFGLKFLIGKVTDTDGDGVSDKRDKCPNTPSGVKVDAYGCALDSDGDGVADHKDSCPEVAGTAATNGCPDTDGDGITDKDDACPEVKGVASANGCPDSDGDGIVDSKDDCPTVKGIASLNGCPDSDNDGVTDSKDDCPNVAGIAATNGCPDTDKDGIKDSEDKCPTVAGVAANNGCPEVKEEVKEVFDRALKGIQFQSGRDVIKTSSYGILNNVATIMKENSSYKLDINGHTDSMGDDTKNMTLSKNRAEAVKKYLVSKGVDASRMASYGFGETQPKADNGTSAGRAENRRVEFKVRF